MNTVLTERQQHELDYHREHAHEHQDILSRPFSWAVLQDPGQRWWNAYWQMYAFLARSGLAGKNVLVVGCGFGDDALRLAKLGARVSAFDLSPESLDIARRLATREGLGIDFRQMPAERLDYADASFDCIVARDILHHVDIAATMREITRVSKPGALFVADEIYSHSITDRLRHARLVEHRLYPRMRRLVYGTAKPYITADERKLSEHDVAAIRACLGTPVLNRHFNFVTTRLIPDRWNFAAQLDQLALRALRPLAPWLAGRILLAAPVAKTGTPASTPPVG